MLEIERKRIRFELKADTPGAFSAVFATLNVVDHDGDVTVPGAFKDGSEVIIGSWGHKTYELPVGKGVIRTSPTEATVDGAFFLDTGPGKDTYQTVKNLGPLGEWSYVYTVTKQSFGEQAGRPVRFLEGLDVYSVDPVLAGAGIDTRTTDIKGRGLGFVEHCEEMDERVNEFLERVKARLEVRERERKEGRMLSTANVERLRGIAESLKSSAGDLEKLLETAEPKSYLDELDREFVRYELLRAGLPA